MAVCFTAVLNWALLATFAADRLPAAWLGSTTASAAAWVLVLGLWVVGLVQNRAALWSAAHKVTTGQATARDERLQEAQTHYLKGHWIEAETCLSTLLAAEPEDAEALLLLASIERRTGRIDAAVNTLVELQQSAAATRWAWEIRTELARLASNTQEPPRSSTPIELPEQRAA